MLLLIVGGGVVMTSLVTSLTDDVDMVTDVIISVKSQELLLSTGDFVGLRLLRLL